MGGSESTQRGPAGFRIFRIWKGSPAHLSGLEMFFDCIIEIDGLSFISQKVGNEEFPNRLKEVVGKTTKFVIYNSRTKAFRDVWMTPRHWNAESMGLLGATVLYESSITKEYQGVRVLEIQPNSPASEAGLTPFDDYIMGSVEAPIESPDELIDYFLTSMSKIKGGNKNDAPNQVAILVYNVRQETVREVLISPNYHWGGEGCLGCDVGQGLLHTIPSPVRIHPNSYSRYIYPSNDSSGSIDAIIPPGSPEKMNPMLVVDHLGQSGMEVRYGRAFDTSDKTVITTPMVDKPGTVQRDEMPSNFPRGAGVFVPDHENGQLPYDNLNRGHISEAQMQAKISPTTVPQSAPHHIHQAGYWAQSSPQLSQRGGTMEGEEQGRNNDTGVEYWKSTNKNLDLTQQFPRPGAVYPAMLQNKTQA